ncbi:MAG: hypothetical protein AB7S38_24350 [Vulcanimicrobiota bacterium]
MGAGVGAVIGLAAGAATASIGGGWGLAAATAGAAVLGAAGGYTLGSGASSDVRKGITNACALSCGLAGLAGGAGALAFGGHPLVASAVAGGAALAGFTLYLANR